ncbi:hypothetical protein DFJ73DRAFT_387833 [Zopfochytrium polystomum]|nr:hypothetical protein DFJ73DRAFT_387833 [Zopfochytrium polystomum]
MLSSSPSPSQSSSHSTTPTLSTAKILLSPKTPTGVHSRPPAPIPASSFALPAPAQPLPSSSSSASSSASASKPSSFQVPLRPATAMAADQPPPSTGGFHIQSLTSPTGNESHAPQQRAGIRIIQVEPCANPSASKSRGALFNWTSGSGADDDDDEDFVYNGSPTQYSQGLGGSGGSGGGGGGVITQKSSNGSLAKDLRHRPSNSSLKAALMAVAGGTSSSGSSGASVHSSVHSPSPINQFNSHGPGNTLGYTAGLKLANVIGAAPASSASSSSSTSSSSSASSKSSSPMPSIPRKGSAGSLAASSARRSSIGRSSMKMRDSWDYGSGLPQSVYSAISSPTTIVNHYGALPRGFLSEAAQDEDDIVIVVRNVKGAGGAGSGRSRRVFAGSSEQDPLLYYKKNPSVHTHGSRWWIGKQPLVDGR